MDKDKRLDLDFKVFLWRKNEIVGELDDTVKVLTAAFGIELNDILMHEVGFVLVLMPHTMMARLRRINETSRQMVVFSAIVELHVPTHRDEKHHKNHHQRSDLQDSFFHAAKIRFFLKPKSH